MSPNPLVAALLQHLVLEQDYATALGITPRTVVRQPQQGLPHVKLSGASISMPPTPSAGSRAGSLPVISRVNVLLNADL